MPNKLDRHLGFLIDPLAQQISQVWINTADRHGLTDMYKVLDCDMVEPVYLNAEEDTLWVDEEGLLKNPQYFFYIEGLHQPMAGRGLVLGTKQTADGGISVDPKTVTLDWLREHTAFVHRLPGLLAINSPESIRDQVHEFFA